MTSHHTLGERVRDLRTVRHMSQEDLASKTGLTVGTISRIERGMIRPREVTVRALARALRCSVDDLREAEEE